MFTISAWFLWNRRSAIHFGRSVHPTANIISLAGNLLQDFLAAQELDPVVPRPPIWDARTRLPGERTHVRRGGTRRRGRDAADRASVPPRATWRVPNRADAAKIGADAAEIDADAAEIDADVAQIGPTRSVSAGIGRNRPNRPVSAETARFGPKFKKDRKSVV